MAIPPLPPRLVKNGRVVAGAATVPSPIVPPTVDFVSQSEGSEVLRCIGLKSLEQTLLNIPKGALDCAGFEIQAILEDVIEDSRENYCPFLTGNLKDSGMADEYKIGMTAGGLVRMACWYGAPGMNRSGGTLISQLGVSFHPSEGPDFRKIGHGRSALTEDDLHVPVDPSEYARYQHETLGLDHHGIGGPKYLERPWLIMEPQMIPRIAAAIENWLIQKAGLTDLGAIEDAMNSTPIGPYGAAR